MFTKMTSKSLLVGFNTVLELNEPMKMDEQFSFYNFKNTNRLFAMMGDVGNELPESYRQDIRVLIEPEGGGFNSKIVEKVKLQFYIEIDVNNENAETIVSKINNAISKINTAREVLKKWKESQKELYLAHGAEYNTWANSMIEYILNNEVSVFTEM